MLCAKAIARGIQEIGSNGFTTHVVGHTGIFIRGHEPRVFDKELEEINVIDLHIDTGIIGSLSSLDRVPKNGTFYLYKGNIHIGDVIDNRILFRE